MGKSTNQTNDDYRPLEHPDYWCAQPWCLALPTVDSDDGRVAFYSGYHRIGVETVEIEYGVVAQVGVGVAEDDGPNVDNPVVHMLLISDDAYGDEAADTFDTVMTLEEADRLVASLAAATARLRQTRSLIARRNAAAAAPRQGEGDQPAGEVPRDHVGQAGCAPAACAGGAR